MGCNAMRTCRQTPTFRRNDDIYLQVQSTAKTATSTMLLPSYGRRLKNVIKILENYPLIMKGKSEVVALK
jgi:hypothetical protein